MNIPFFDLKRQNSAIRKELQLALDRVLDNSHLILGEEVKRFEKNFAQYQQLHHFVACANGSDALELALQASDLQPRDEVIVPAFGWLSPALAVKNSGGTVVFADVERSNYGLSPQSLKSKVTSKTKCIIVEHLFGGAAEIQELSELADKYQLILIEDCAQAQGVHLSGRMLGTFGQLSTFSFYPTKNLGALGDAGGIGTKDDVMAERLRALRNYGKNASRIDSEGRNSRMDELQAAFLNTKLNFLNSWNQRRRSIAIQYCEALEIPIDAVSTYHQFVIQVRDRSAFRNALQSAGIQTAVHYDFDQLAIYGDTSSLPNSQKLVNSVVSLPIFPELTQEEILYICQHLQKLKEFIS